jgi:hypothetical protein
MSASTVPEDDDQDQISRASDGNYSNSKSGNSSSKGDLTSVDNSSEKQTNNCFSRSKLVVMAMVFLFGAGAAAGTFIYTSNSQEDQFESQVRE